MRQGRGTAPRSTVASFCRSVCLGAFAVLAVTGFILLWPGMPLAGGEAGEMNRLLHRVFGMVLIAAAIASILFSPGRDEAQEAGPRRAKTRQLVLFEVLVLTGLGMWIGSGRLPGPVLLGMFLVHALAAIAASGFVIVRIFRMTRLPPAGQIIWTTAASDAPPQLVRARRV